MIEKYASLLSDFSVIEIHIGLETGDFLFSTYDTLVASSNFFDIREQLIKQLYLFSDNSLIISNFSLNFSLHSQKSILVNSSDTSLCDLSFDLLFDLGQLNTLSILVEELLHIAISKILKSRGMGSKVFILD